MRPNVNLKSALLEAGVTQRELAKKVHLHETVISLVIRGRYVLDEGQRERIALVLGHPVEELFND